MGNTNGIPAKDLVYEYVRREILWDPSEETRFLAEETVGNELGVSRTPVREAFLRLEAEGFLQLVPRKGAMILPITEREVREVMEVRSLIELHCARRIFEIEGQRASLAQSMRARQDELLALGSNPEPSAFIECDRVFHRELVVAAGNHMMLDLYERMRDRQLRVGVRAVVGAPARIEAVHAEHERIVAALDESDPSALIAAIDAHLTATAQATQARLAAS